MTEEKTLDKRALALVCSIYSHVGLLDEIMVFDNVDSEKQLLLQTLETSKFIELSEKKRCNECKSIIPENQKFCKQHTQRTSYHKEKGYFLTDRFGQYLNDMVKEKLQLLNWEVSSDNNLFFLQEKRCKTYITIHYMSDRDFFIQEALGIRENIHYLMIILPSSSDNLKKLAKYSDLNILILEANDILNNDLDDKIKSFIMSPVKIELLRKYSLRDFILKGVDAESIVEKIMQEKQ